MAFPGVLSASAQDASLRGRVVDPQGAVITGAAVSIAADGQPPKSVTASDEGTFDFDGLPAGTYVVRVEAPGFAPSETAVRVGSGSQRLTVTLSIAGVAHDVTVRGTVIGTAATGKTTAPLRELPMTVHGVSSELIAAQGANDLVSVIKNVPSVNAFTTYGVYEYYTFRGFLDSVQLVDGVRQEGNRVNTQLTNVERVDVLKGPASALYGGAALGATVNIIRKKPSAARAYDFTGAFGSWETTRGAFGAGGRLTDNAFYRLDLGGESREGYRHDNAKRVTVTPSVAWMFGNSGQLNAYYTFNRDRFGGDAGLPLVDTSLGAPTKNNVIDVPRDRNYRTPQDDATSQDHNLQLVYARQLTDSIGFRNTFGVRAFNDKYFLSEDVSFSAPNTINRYYLFFEHHRRPLINFAELTAHLRRGVEQDLLIGWETQRYHNYTRLPEEDYFEATPIDAFAPIETQGPSDLTLVRQNVFTNLNNAAYINDHITLGPTVKALLGGRLDIYRRQSHSDAIDGDRVTAEGPVARREANAFTGRAGLVWQASGAVDIYGSFANAFKAPTLAQPNGQSLEPETGAQVEIGQRFHLLRDRAQLNTAIFNLTRKNVAFRRAAGVYVQAGEVRSRGFEADFQSSLSSRLQLNAAYGYADAEFADYEESEGVNRRGNQLTFAPRHTFNAWTSYDWASGFGANIGIRYLSRVFVDSANTFSVDGYATVSAAIRYRRGAAEFGLNINNLTDTSYLTPHLDYLTVYPGQPINALATVRIRLR